MAWELQVFTRLQYFDNDVKFDELIYLMLTTW